jgi:hypothetical protein
MDDERVLTILWEISGDKLTITVENEEGRVTSETWKGINPDDYGEMDIFLDDNDNMRSSKEV